MDKELAHIRQETPSVLRRLESAVGQLETTVYSAARDVRALKKAGSGDYADAILNRNGFGGDTAEIYFYRFAPRGSARPSNQAEFQALMADPERSREYVRACYEKWLKEVQAVEKIVQRYGGKLEVNGAPFEMFQRWVANNPTRVPDHRVHVKITFPGQVELRTLRELIG